MQAKSIKGRSAEEIQSAVTQSMTQGFTPTLAIVFISIKQDRKAVCEILRKEGIDVVGATSCGEFIEGYQDEGSIVILLLDLQREAFTILFEEIGSQAVSEVAAQLTKKALQKFKHPALIICTTGVNLKGEYFDGEALVQGIENAGRSTVTFYGGMAGDDDSFTGTYVFTNDKETDFGIAALVLDEDKVVLQGMAITGWKPMGISRTITKSKGNLVYTIDNQPAPEMYLKYLGKEAGRNDRAFNLMQDVGMHYPLMLAREVGEPVLRTPMRIDKSENALVCDLDMPGGGRLWFSMPPDLDIAETILDEARQLKNSSMLDAEALLIFSCAGRLNVLGPLVRTENDGLSGVWDTPMSGFFTYGEYGRALKGKQEFHSGACCWVALKEK